MDKIKKCIEISLELSKKLDVWARCRHFSFILDRQRIISTGINNKKTHPINLFYNYVNKKHESISSIVGTHSEMKAALFIGIDNCKGLTIVNVRINKNGKLAMSKPCRGCMDMIKKAEFSDVWYTDNFGKLKQIKNEDF